MVEWCSDLGVQQRVTFVGNPQANGQVEVTNITIVRHLETRLQGKIAGWADDLRTTTSKTPYAPVYGSEAAVPLELQIPSSRILTFDSAQNIQVRGAELDLLE